MKLATLHDGSRDGQLVVVSRDLTSAHLASHVAGTLQQVLDDWNFLSPQLEDVYAMLNGGKARHAFAFEQPACLAPLPRAHLWAPVSGLARSDAFLRPQAEVALDTSQADARPGWQVQLAAITGDVTAGADDDTALDGVRLLLLSATWGPRGAVRASVFGPVAATPDELGTAWRGGRALEPLAVQRDAAELALAVEPDDVPGPGLARRIAALARMGDQGQGQGHAHAHAHAHAHGLGAGSLVGGWAQDAGMGWAPGSHLVLQWHDPLALGAVRLRAPA